MMMPSKWQQTFTFASSRVIGDVDTKGKSIFRNSSNKDTTNFARMDLSYQWKDSYQTGIGAKFQQRNRETESSDNHNSGWSDVALFQAWRPSLYYRSWIFQTLNVPTAKSVYDSEKTNSIDAHGTGTWQAGLGGLHVENGRNWDMITSAELHHSFARGFERSDVDLEVGSFWGGSVTVGGGWIPWKSKWRYGLNLTPRFEGAKEVRAGNEKSISRQSLVWDTNLNTTYTMSAHYSLGLSYIDQTIFGPASNTILSRSIAVLFQSHWL